MENAELPGEKIAGDCWFDMRDTWALSWLICARNCAIVSASVLDVAVAVPVCVGVWSVARAELFVASGELSFSKKFGVVVFAVKLLLPGLLGVVEVRASVGV